ncbi:MAG: carbohydrate binding family 9 domain-containing protein [Bacteroidales bacterium]
MKKRIFQRFALPTLTAFVLLFSTLSLHSADRVRIARLNGEITLDGRPDEPAWTQATPFDLIMHVPNAGAQPGERSDIWMAYDNEYLYVGARLYVSDPSRISSNSTKRDEQSRNTDVFGIILDTYDDNENALAFFTMPSGARIDYSVGNDAESSGGPERSTNLSWNTFWDVETQMDDQGWYVEMRIPFSSLRFQSVDGISEMGLIINRRIAALNETDTWPMTDPKYGFSAYYKPSLAQTVEFQDVKARKPLYISPYIIGDFPGTMP